MLAGAVLILAGVMSLALYSFRKERRVSVSHRVMLVGGGLIFPTVTMGALMIFAFIRGEQLSPQADATVLTLEAHATQWRWLFTYPDGEQTEGVLHVPAAQTFHVRVTSGDVIHSFWAPRLGGKIDAVPGKQNLIALRADRPGLYGGVCSEFCGIGHAQMFFRIHAHASEDYAAALAQADDTRVEQREVLEPRDPPAAERIDEAIDSILRGGDQE